MLARVPLSLVSPVASAGYSGLKRLIASHGRDLVAGGSRLSASVLLFVAALGVGLPATGPLFLPAVAATTALNAVAMHLTVRAFRVTDLSLAVPMLSFRPAVLLTSPFLEGTRPRRSAWRASCRAWGGSYVLNLSARCRSPLRALGRDPGIRALLGVAMIHAFTSQVDKVVVRQSDPFLGAAVVVLSGT